MNTPCYAIIVDDEAWIRNGLSEHINRVGLGIRLAESYEEGRNAIEVLQQQQPIEVIITDIHMRYLTGIELLAEVRQLESCSPSAPPRKVVIISGFNDFKYAQEAVRLGAFDYLLKPADVEKIEAALLRARTVYDQEFLHSYERSNSSVTSASVNKDKDVEVSSYLVKKALQLLDDQFTEEMHLAQIAEELYITPNYLSRIFKQETGKSFSQYLSMKRVERACQLLTTSTLKIYQVGEAVGYPNSRYFSEWFQKQTGLSPSDYRNSHS
ncbi:AraC family transcriptional regulator [Paenibacillaceae bacterium]|nr:AraC family transcriptional regulator [Paenibacillaceae bacterium]